MNKRKDHMVLRIKKIKKLLLPAVLFFLCIPNMLSLVSCRSNDIYVFEESDAVTEEEKQAIINHIRHFVTKSRLSLSRPERNYIRRTPPVFKVHYTGHKRGDLTVRWNFPNYRSIILKRKGHLLFEGRIHWDVRIITDKASPTIPRSYFGSKGEDISRMKPEAAEVLKQWQGDVPKSKR